LGRTELTGPIPTEIGNLTHLCKCCTVTCAAIRTRSLLISQAPSTAARLLLSQMKLKGTIPTEIGALSNLFQLHFEQQELFGTIPTELSLLTKLGESEMSPACREFEPTCMLC